MSVTQYGWEPGNATHYDVIVSDMGEGLRLLSWMHQGGSGGSTLKFGVGEYVSVDRVMEKMDIREGDAYAILGFMHRIGARVAPHLQDKYSHISLLEK